MEVLNFAISALAVWRITHLLGKEDGPFDIIFRIRKKAGVGFLGSMLDCFYCLSVWVALPVALYYSVGWKEALITWPALSGAACLLENAISQKSTDHKKTIYSED